MFFYEKNVKLIQIPIQSTAIDDAESEEALQQLTQIHQK